MSEVDIAAVAELLGDVFPHAPIGDVDYLRWLYEDSPFGGVLHTDLIDDQGLAGHYAVVPVDLAVHGAPLAGALSLNDQEGLDKFSVRLFAKHPSSHRAGGMASSDNRRREP